MSTFQFKLKPNKWLIASSLVLGIGGVVIWWMGPSPSWQAALALVLTNFASIPLLKDYRMRTHWYRHRLETDWSSKLVEAMRAENPWLLRLPGPPKTADTSAREELEKLTKEMKGE